MVPDNDTANPLDLNWQNLYRLGGAAALLAALIFRRNFAAEINLFVGVPIPMRVEEWFTLLQDQRLLGLILYGLFDLLNVLLLSLMFLSLLAVFWRSQRQLAGVAAAAGLLGAAVYQSSNQALAMLNLSREYAAASSPAEGSAAVTAGKALLAINNPAQVYQGTGLTVSFFLLALATLLFGTAMLRSRLFNRWTASAGLAAGAFDLAFCLALALAPADRIEIFGLALIPAAGLLLMIWHLLTGIRLLQLGSGRKIRTTAATPEKR